MKNINDEQNISNKKKFEDMIFFQNLVPGTQHSPFINDFINNCLSQDEDDDSKNYRTNLLERHPPVLSFKGRDEMEEFYKKQASNCSFCCGGVQPGIESNSSEQTFSKEDRFMVSWNTDTFYEGAADQIKQDMKTDMASLENGDPQKQNLDSGIEKFNDIVEQRQQHGIPLSKMPDLNTAQLEAAPNIDDQQNETEDSEITIRPE